MSPTTFRGLRAERLIVGGSPVLPVLTGEAAPDAGTEAETGQLYLRIGTTEALYICVAQTPERRWRRVQLAK